MFAREIRSWDKTCPGMKISLSMLKSVILTIYVFSPVHNFVLGLTHPCQKDRDQISSRGKSKKKRCPSTLFPDEILQWVCFLKKFLIHVVNILFNLNIIEHNESYKKDIIGSS